MTIKASMNLGLSPELKDKFSDIEAVKRPLIVDKNVPASRPFWMARKGVPPDWFYYLVVFINY